MWYILIAGMIIVAELKIKNKMNKRNARKDKKEILGGHITLETYHNTGMCMSVLHKKKKLVLTITSTMLGILTIFFFTQLPKKDNKMMKLGLAFVLGGAYSNVIDRFRLGYVIDYFSFRKLKKIVFNLADMFIFVGGMMVYFATLFGKHK